MLPYRRRVGQTEESSPAEETEVHGWRRQSGGALVPVEGRSVREKEVGDPASQKGSRTKSRQREIEDIPREPVGQPEVWAPKSWNLCLMQSK